MAWFEERRENMQELQRWRGGGCWKFGDEMYTCGRGKGEVGGVDK